MAENLFEVESFKKFSESLIWQLNRDYYNQAGIAAWSKGIVPHQVTSNSLVGRTYAELILGFLKDLATQDALEETVYIIELGAGHGRLGYHILKHLEQLTTLLHIDLPPYCYVLTDIVEENLTFFQNHPQLKAYYEKGQLDYAYYDGINGKNIKLRYADRIINQADLNQPLIAIGNYFFDSIPTDLFYIHKDSISSCEVSLHSSDHLKSLAIDPFLKQLEFKYKNTPIEYPYYDSNILNALLKYYETNLSESYLFFPEKGIACVQNLSALSTKGLMLLSMDKGVHELEKLKQKITPDIVTHGSFSLWVNYHALGHFCEQTGGKAMFPEYSNFHLEVACLLFMDNAPSYTMTNAAYEHSVNNFGPDDFNTLKKFSYAVMTDMTLTDLIAMLRLSAYDSIFFTNILPQIKNLVKQLSHQERRRIAQTLDQVWGYYFNINESEDLALTMAGIFFDLGYYDKALAYYDYSTAVYGIEMDTYYNKILCYYQLRQDDLFALHLKEANRLFPDTNIYERLEQLDLSLT